jgi:hypothetical protein
MGFSIPRSGSITTPEIFLPLNSSMVCMSNGGFSSGKESEGMRITNMMGRLYNIRLKVERSITHTHDQLEVKFRIN